MKKIVLSLLIFLSAASLQGCELNVEETLLVGGADVPYHKLAMNFFPRNRTAGDLATQMADIKALGIGVIRVTFWFDSQYMSGPGAAPDFSQFDEVVNAANDAGIIVVAILGYVPGWLAGDASWKTTFISDFVSPVVSRYAGSIDYWEVWNEPDELTYGALNGTADDYFDLLMRTAPVIRALDSSSVIVAAATANIVADNLNKFNWTQRLLDLGLATYSDVLNFHYYSDLDIELSAIGGPMATGSGLRVWVTETGYAGHGGQENYFSTNMAYIDKSIAPEIIFWYTYVQGAGAGEETHPDSSYGLVTYFGGARYESSLYTHLKNR